MKKCPFCAEEIQDEAIKCRYCGEFLDDSEEEVSASKQRLSAAPLTSICLLFAGILLLWFIYDASQIEQTSVPLFNYEIVDHRIRGDAGIIEVKTNAPISSLADIAKIIVEQKRSQTPHMVRVYFYFNDENVDINLPRYRYEWSSKGVQIHDFTEDRKRAEMKY